MKPSASSIGKFRSLWKSEYGEELPEELAREYAGELLKLGRVIYRNRIVARERAPPLS